MSRKLQQALEDLYGLERRKDKLGLDGTRVLLTALGNPERSFRAIHVAGTNGKGSVCAMVERVLREAGVRTGLFTSPHLVDFRERIRVSGRWAEESWLERALARIQALPEGRDRTFFEVATALGFLYFAEHDVQWAVVEVGLGGRLDTTNVLTPEVCAITSIGLDHTEILGNTLGLIAGEKAGIVKPGVPVVVGAMAKAAFDVIAQRAADEHARVIPVARDTGDAASKAGPASPWGPLEVEIAMNGEHQRMNVAIALGVLAELVRGGVAIPATAVTRGLGAARWPGRLEPCPSLPRLWWDGAHNPEGMAALASAWRELTPVAPGAVVLALSRDKDVSAVFAALAPLGPGAVVATRSRSERALEPERIAEAARAAGLSASVAPDVVSACRAALAEAPADTRVLLTGSLFAVGEAMESFGGAPGEWL